MKTTRLLMLFFITTLMSCENNDHGDVLTTLKGESGLSYNESLSNWNALKSENGNSYVFEITFTSWRGISSLTELTVENGVVIARNYEGFVINHLGEREVVESYSETEVDLGAHEKGARPVTIDDLYNTCANDYLVVSSKKNKLYFDAELDGLMSVCGFVPKGCMDDCFRGVEISSFRWIK